MWQLINVFVEKERIPLDGVRCAEILLGRDTRPSGDALLEAARQVWELGAMDNNIPLVSSFILFFFR